MHALHRPHLPRLIEVSIIAGLFAIAITLALAAGLNDLTTHGTQVRSSAAPVTLRSPSATPTVSAAAGWARSPFANLTPGPVALPWLSAGRR